MRQASHLTHCLRRPDALRCVYLSAGGRATTARCITCDVSGAQTACAKLYVRRHASTAAPPTWRKRFTTQTALCTATAAARVQHLQGIQVLLMSCRLGAAVVHYVCADVPSGRRPERKRKMCILLLLCVVPRKRHQTVTTKVETASFTATAPTQDRMLHSQVPA